VVQQKVSLGAVAACGLWFLAIALMVIGVVVRFAGDDDWAYVALTLGIAHLGAAITLTTRLTVDRQTQLLRDAYQFGHDSAADVRRINA
jgi:hypothetical protein